MCFKGGEIVQFLNNETILSIIQLTEWQWKVYQEFLKLAANEDEARKQTQIHMNAMMQKKESASDDGMESL
jgi:hypothetical protein